MLITQASDVDPASPAPVELAPALLAHLAAIRTQALDRLTSGTPVYGVNTGMGAMSKRQLTPEEQSVHQQNLLLGRAVGGPPWLPPPEARAVLLGRLKTFLNGDAAVSVELIGQLVDLINSGDVPNIPAGGAGSAGEIIPLSHAFAGLTVGPKEGIALIAGIPGASGRAALWATRARALVERMTEVASGAIVVVGANRDPYRAAVGRGDNVLAEELRRVRELVAEEPEPRSLQAPVSFRVAGHVQANVRRAVAGLEAAVERAFTGVTDSPAYLDGEFVGTAGFHGIDLVAYCDQLTVALAHAAEVSATRLHRLLDPKVTGLPAQLARDPGPQAGMVTVHKRAVATTHQLRRLTLPTAIGMTETSNGQEDVQTFSWEAVGNLGEAVRLTRETIACELLAVRQAFYLQGKQGIPEDLMKAVDAVVPSIDVDRPFGQDLTNLLESVL